MKDYYLNRFRWIFNYTSSNVLYCIAKTLCIIVGLPIYAVVFVAEMVLTFVNMLFCWIPVVNVLVAIVCKGITFIIEKAYYICILTDLKKFRDEQVYVSEDGQSDGTYRIVLDDEDMDVDTDSNLDVNVLTDDTTADDDN